MAAPGSVTRTLDVGLVQLNSGDDKPENIRQAIAGVTEAAERGARLIMLPEVWPYLGPDAANAGAAESIPGPLTDTFSELARSLDVFIHMGSIFERVPGQTRLFNTSVVLDPSGEIIGRYRKIHLFDVDLTSDAAYRESATIAPGEEIVDVEIDGVRVGLTICYDLRFPELYRILALRGADVIVCPAAFTMATGKDHWEPLIRARAIENTLYLVAPGQVGKHPPGLWCYGRSMVVDPWGVVVAQANDVPGVLVTRLDLDHVTRIRQQVPSLRNRMPAAYAWPQPVSDAGIVAADAVLSGP